jgi:hypothetical protein
MKKVTLTGKLSLNKETVTKLNDAQMGVIKGGVILEAEARPKSSRNGTGCCGTKLLCCTK